ncbi:MAG: hypothetical protein PVH56_14180, partial [Desulfobacterales bacterium]
MRPPGFREWILYTCPESATTQGPTASRLIDTASVVFHLLESVGTLKFTASCEAQLACPHIP